VLHRAVGVRVEPYLRNPVSRIEAIERISALDLGDYDGFGPIDAFILELALNVN
jgi:hypothetical protein